MSLSFSKIRNFIGAETTLVKVIARAELAAESGIPLFLLGERGVGKETFAREIGGEKTVKLCGELVNELRWNEFFAAGALNDSLINDPSAAFYFADVESIPKKIQRRLASFARSSVFRAQAIFSSSKPYQKLLEDGDLEPAFNSLLVAFPIYVPNLRERVDDLAKLANLFLKDACNRLGAWQRPLSALEHEQLRRTAFPENLDDLRRCMELVALNGSLPRDLFDSLESNGEQQTRDSATQKGKKQKEETFETFPSLDEIAVQHIERALKLTNGVVEGKGGAAALLKINPYTLRSRMRKMKVDWTKFRKEP